MAVWLDSHGLVVEAREASGVMPLVWGVTGHRAVGRERAMERKLCSMNSLICENKLW